MIFFFVCDAGCWVGWEEGTFDACVVVPGVVWTRVSFDVCALVDWGTPSWGTSWIVWAGVSGVVYVWVDWFCTSVFAGEFVTSTNCGSSEVVWVFWTFVVCIERSVVYVEFVEIPSFTVVSTPRVTGTSAVVWVPVVGWDLAGVCWVIVWVSEEGTCWGDNIWFFYLVSTVGDSWAGVCVPVCSTPGTAVTGAWVTVCAEGIFLYLMKLILER